MKTVYQTDAEGFFIGSVQADPSPLEPGVWLIPGGAVEIAPPALSEGQRAQWVDSKWTVVDPEPELEPEPDPTPEELLAAERENMLVSPAQMRLTLHRMGLLAQVQAIADADPEASIVWEYATVIERNSPLIDALGGDNGFTAEQIDDIFRAAMQV